MRATTADAPPATPAPGPPPRRSVKGPAAVAVVLVAAVVAAVLLLPGGDEPATVEGRPAGRAAPGFELENLQEGEPPVRLADYRGRPVVVNFWASWCVPCRDELPAFQRAFERMEGRIAFVGVNTKDSRRLGLAFARQAGITFPSGYDPANTTFDRYRLLGMPSTIFVSAEGTAVERHAGELDEDDLLETLQRLFPADFGDDRG